MFDACLQSADKMEPGILHTALLPIFKENVLTKEVRKVDSRDEVVHIWRGLSRLCLISF